MKKFLAILLAAVMAFAMTSVAAAEEAPAEYTQQKVFDGTYGFGDAEITVKTNDDMSAFDITFVCFDEDQELIGTITNGICMVSYDETGFVAGDCQQIWDDACASENAWEPIDGAAPAEEAAAEEAPAEEAAVEEVAAEEAPAEEAEESAAVTAAFATTTGGEIMGYRYDGVDNYLDILYATAERFQAPVAASWDGLRCCNVLGEVAPQSDIETASRDLFNCFPINLLQVENEQTCLNLNVWTPETGSGSRPVIVWLHGGGYTTGSSTQFNFYLGESMAKDYDVVFVSVNHRLNSLGYLDLSAYGDEYKYSGNNGMLDIQMALEWVQENIAEFGGDPSNVTIVGQSGGGGKVTTLMSMPSAQGLFHKAVALSGGTAQITRTTETAQADTAKLVTVLGLDGASNEEIIDTLVNLPYDELHAACTEASVSFGPVVDGDLIPTGTYEISKDIPFIASNVMGEFSTNYAAVVPYTPSEDVHNMLAGMSDEMAAEQYIATYGEEYGPQIMEAFQEAYPTHPLRDGLYLNNRVSGGMSALPLLQAMESYGGTQIYNSLVAYDYPMYGGIVPIHTASSIPFWFDNVDDIKEFVAGDEENAQKVNDAMSGALAAFAYTGNPSTETLTWDAYTTEGGATMVFDAESQVKYHFDEKLLTLIAEAKAAAEENK